MRRTILSLLLLIVSLSFSQRTLFIVKGQIQKVYREADDRTLLCIKSNSSENIIVVLSRKMEIENRWTLKGDVAYPDNDGFINHLAFFEIGKRDSLNPVPRVKLKFLSLKDGSTQDSKVMANLAYAGRWVGNQEIYCYYGKTIKFTGETIKVDRVSSVPRSEVSSDLKWCVNAVVMKDERGKNIASIELENLENQDMLSVEAYPYTEDSTVLAEFAANPRYLFFRSKLGPSLYDIKKQQTLNVLDLSYKRPHSVGFYLNNDKYFYLYDYAQFVIVNTSLQVEEVYSNPFADDQLEILDADKFTVTGVLYRTTNQERDYLKFFIHNFKKAENRLFPLPVSVKKVWVKEGVASYLYMEGEEVRFNQIELRLK